MLVTRIVTVMALVLLGACAGPSAAYREPLPRQPTDGELANSGNLEEQRALYRRYRVRMANGQVWAGPVRRAERPNILTPEPDADIRAYLSAEPAARALLSTSSKPLAWTGVGIILASLPVLLAGAPGAIMVGLGLVMAMDVLAWSYVRNPQVRPLAPELNVATSMFFTCVLVVAGTAAVLPGHLLGAVGAALWEYARRRDQGALEQAMERYNATLAQRIQQQATPSSSASAKQAE
ncbi:MAG: hypothetical protein AB2A00_22430 [Myxococcota bacterium]